MLIVVLWVLTLCCFVGGCQNIGGTLVNSYEPTGRHNTEDFLDKMARKMSLSQAALFSTLLPSVPNSLSSTNRTLLHLSWFTFLINMFNSNT
jgi:hypothetical protein